MKRKKYLLLIFLGLILLYNSSHAQVLTDLSSLQQDKPFTSVQTMPLEQKLREIEDVFNVHIFYKSEEIKNKFVSKRKERFEKPEELLNRLLEPINMSYRKLTQNSFVVFERNITPEEINIRELVSGSVTDERTREALPGVNITVKGTSTGTATNADGFYELNVPSLTDTLLFSYIGYEMLEIPIEGRTEINIELSPQTYTGEELVVGRIGGGKNWWWLDMASREEGA